jgi:hypothetical protein
MPQRKWERWYLYNGSRVNLEEELIAWGNSPRDPSGKLRLQTNVLSHHKSQCVSFSSTWPGEKYRGSAQPNQLNSHRGAEYLAHQQAYARLRGQLYKGSAALGVTLASFKQSREMVRNRSNLIASSAAELSALSSKSKMTKRLADNYLEVIFGWQPLIADVHAATTSVIQRADALEFVRGSGTVPIAYTERGRWDSTRHDDIAYRGSYRVSLGGQVRISNPNAWLLERAGLANPLAVAWDIVPWSFLINMFTNVGALVNQISDFYGLSFSNTFTARRVQVTQVMTTRQIVNPVWVDTLVALNTDKDRNPGFSAPPIKLSFRTPDLSWGTAAMAASLMVQQAVPVFRLMSRYSRTPGGIPYTE